MCGIAGFFGEGDTAILRRMAVKIQHRGPDADGFHEEPETGIYLAHRRLAIIDLAGGAQPMSTSDGALTIVFNGEIYNFRELRSELERAGHVFATDHSDTEVLLHGYRQWGADLVNRLNGMWAFAIFDRRKRQAFFSRDRFGKKPLYYARNSGTFAFASELTALMEHPAMPRDTDDLALRKYYAYGYVPAPRTLFRNVFKLPAAHNLLLDLNTLDFRTSRFWSYKAEPDESLDFSNADSIAEELRACVDRAVAHRLVSDVPVGAFLSGGIDSSYVSALALKHKGAEGIRLFSIGFDEAGFDETRFARRVAAHLGAQHSVETLSVQRALDIVPILQEKLDEPFADSSLLPTYLLCRHAKESVTVALGGDGADELFAGYDPFKALRYARAYASWVPKPVHQAILLMADRMPVSHGYMSFDFKVKRTLRGLSHPASQWLPAWMAPLSTGELGELFGEGYGLEEIYSEAIETWEASQSRDIVDRTTAFFVNLYLQENILPKVDRASMLNSLEVRSPFLDPEVVSLASRIPARLKLKGSTTKWILKRSAEPLLPHDIIYRRKQGFAVPIGQWFQEGRLTTTADGARGSFWAGLAGEHRAGRRDNRLALWANFIAHNYALGAR